MREILTLREAQKLSIRQRRNSFITEQACKQVVTRDNQEPLVDLVQYSKFNKLPIVVRSAWSRKQVPKTQARRSVAERLAVASRAINKLFPNYLLKVRDAHRPICLQRQLFREIARQVARRNPEAVPKELYLETTKFIADPDNLPPHSTGGAIDITIFDRRTGKDLDMGSKMNSIGDLSNTFCSKIPVRAKKNRKRLYDAMIKAGFVNVATEWWHYSYGDQCWAITLGKKNALYGPK